MEITHTHLVHTVPQSLTDEDDDEEADMVQLDVRVGERVAERGVDDHEQNDTAHRAKRRLPPLQPLPQEPPTHLKSVYVLLVFP